MPKNNEHLDTSELYPNLRHSSEIPDYDHKPAFIVFIWIAAFVVFNFGYIFIVKLFMPVLGGLAIIMPIVLLFAANWLWEQYKETTKKEGLPPK